MGILRTPTPHGNRPIRGGHGNRAVQHPWSDTIPLLTRNKPILNSCSGAATLLGDIRIVKRVPISRRMAMACCL